MDPQKLKEVLERIDILDDRLGFKLRARGTARSTTEQLDDRVRDLVEYASELRQLVRDLVVAVGSRSPAPKA